MRYRPRREWAWDQQALDAYTKKREVLAAKGYESDEDVARYFAENGVSGVRPEDVRAIMLDAVTETPAARALRELS